MADVIRWTLLGAAGLFVTAIALWALHRLCLRLEDTGYLYYRKPGTGGGASGVLYEIDRLTRPSIEHVESVDKRDAAQEDESGLGSD